MRENNRGEFDRDIMISGLIKSAIESEEIIKSNNYSDYLICEPILENDIKLMEPNGYKFNYYNFICNKMGCPIPIYRSLLTNKRIDIHNYLLVQPQKYLFINKWSNCNFDMHSHYELFFRNINISSASKYVHNFLNLTYNPRNHFADLYETCMSVMYGISDKVAINISNYINNTMINNTISNEYNYEYNCEYSDQILKYFLVFGAAGVASGIATSTMLPRCMKTSKRIFGNIITYFRNKYNSYRLSENKDEDIEAVQYDNCSNTSINVDVSDDLA